MTGDFDVVVRQVDTTHTSQRAKGGLMVRESLDPSSRNWNVVNEPLSLEGTMAPDGSGYGANTIECNCRNAYGQVSDAWQAVSNAVPPAYPNAWLRLKRSGNVLTAYRSADGNNWVQMAWDDPTVVGDMTPLPSQVLVGICTTAHNNDSPGASPLLYLDTAHYADYNSSYVVLPYVQSFTCGSQGFTYVLLDGTTTVDATSIQTTFNGLVVLCTITKSGPATTIAYITPPLPALSTNVVVLRFADTRGFFQTFTNIFVAPLPGGDKYKADNSLPLNQAASWTNSAVPGPVEFGVWDATVTGPMTNDLGGDMTWGGIKILNPTSPIWLTGGNTLTLNGLGGIGVDLDGATQDLGMECGLGVASNQTWTVASGRTLNVGGAVSGPGGLTKAGAGLLSLSGSNAYAGATVVSAGTLGLQANAGNTGGGVCSAISSPTLDVANGTTVQLFADDDIVFGPSTKLTATNASVTLSAGPLTQGQINHTLTLAPAGLTLANVTVTVPDYGDTLALGPIKVSGPVFFAGSGKLDIQSMTDPGVYPADFTGSSYTAVGPVSGQLSMAQTGPGTLVLTGNNTYSGDTTVSHGTLILAGDNSAASGATYVGPGATLQLQATVNNMVDGACSALGTNTLWLASNSALALLADTNANFTGGGQPALEGNVSLYAASLTAGISDQTLAFGLSGIDTTNATVTLSSANPITVQLGSMRLRNGSLVVVAEPGVYVDLAGIRTNGVYPADFTGSSYGSPSEIEWNFGDGSANNTSLCGPIQGVSGFTKDGNAALILWATNSYPGPTVVSNGVLVVSGRIEGGGAVTVAAGATLGGNGTITGPVTVQAGATLSPGIGIGWLAINNDLTLEGTARMQINRTNAPNCDQVGGISTLTYGGTLTVTNCGPGLQAGDTFTLFSAANYVGSFATLNLPALAPGLAWDTSSLQVNGSIRVLSIPTYVYTPTNMAGVGFAYVVRDMLLWYDGAHGHYTNGPIYNPPDQAANQANWDPFISVLGDSVFLVGANTFADDGTLSNQRFVVTLQPAAGGPPNIGEDFYADDGTPFRSQINLSRQNGNPARVAGDKRSGATNFITMAETSAGQLLEFESDARWNNNSLYQGTTRYATEQTLLAGPEHLGSDSAGRGVGLRLWPVRDGYAAGRHGPSVPHGRHGDRPGQWELCGDAR